VSFFKRHPRFWIAIWTVFGFGGLMMSYSALFDHGLEITLLIKGLMGLALAGMMISYLLPEVRKPNA
jgi:hypothetical protein